MKTYYVYILASKRNGTLYIGITNDLKRRIYEHKNKLIKGFSQRYEVNQLVYFEECGNVESAIIYEKKLKKWRREYKIALIEKENSNWVDLSEDWF